MTDLNACRFYAHSRNDDGAGIEELLCEHLRRVADCAGRFATAFGAEEQARAAAILHDLGKYADQFQRRLRDPSQRGRDHWTLGAVAALMAGPASLYPALSIAGHHTGLNRLWWDLHTLGRQWLNELKEGHDRFTEVKGELLLKRFQRDGLARPHIESGLRPTDQAATDMLDLRMLFSALVDADFLETEAHFAGDAQTSYRPRPAGPALDTAQAIAALEDYLAHVRNQHHDAPMAAAREALYTACLGAGSSSQGLFTLSAPTGAGKTLAMLAFALHHAQTHNLRRIILVMPFLNIIDQTARVYRRIFDANRGFDPHTVLEHHSLAAHDEGGPGAEIDGVDNMSRLLAENWDAPVILTTTVQFFESLMANRTSRCRKLHRLAGSVILLDEVQTLPRSLAVATLATLARLGDPAGPYHSTVVFATATQPAFDALDARVRQDLCETGWRPIEIFQHATSAYATASQRVRVQWRLDTPVELDDLAAELCQHKQALCIVNLKRHAIRLTEALANRDARGLLHLSTNMCPTHRAKVLEKVHARLRAGKPLRLVATQCVEAGVDLDFPVVYRAIAPLEAIAQAAGRCNRHGLREPGSVVVFKPKDDHRPYPPGYGEAVDATESYLALLGQQGSLNATEILNSPDRLRAYFEHLYGVSGRAGVELDDEKELVDAIRAGDFPEVARLYRLIGDDTIHVLVPYDREAFEQLRDEALGVRRWTSPLVRDWCRRATPHAIGVFRPKPDAPIVAHLQPISFSHRDAELGEAEWCFSLPGLEYDELWGLSPKTEEIWMV